MQLAEYVKQIVEAEHMGKLVNDPHIEIEPAARNTMRISFDAFYDGKFVRQYAEFKFTAISLGVDNV